MPSAPQLQSPPTERAPAQRRGWLIVAYAALLAGAAFLLLYNLDGHLLWGDEAETATLARNVLRFGVPKTFDGLNQITINASTNDATKSGVWIWSPWLQQYIAAGSFAVLGPTTFAARLPFTLLGWLCVPRLGWVTWRIYGDHRVALAAALLLVTSEMFLLHARQCRYYSISVLGQIILLYGLHLMLGNKRKGAWLMAGALVLQFYSNYIVTVANMPLLAAVAWTLYRRDKRSVWQVALVLGLVAAAAAPWLLFAHTWQQSGSFERVTEFREKVRFYLAEFHFHFLPWVFALLPLGAFLTRLKARAARPTTPGSQAVRATNPRRHSPDSAALTLPIFERHLVLLVPLYLIVLLLPPGQFLRYSLPLLPVAVVLGAAWVFRFVRWPTVAWSLLLVQCFSNFIAVSTAYPWRREHSFGLPFVRFVRGFGLPYTDRLADVSNFLNREAKPGQTVYVFDSEFPLKFYTRQRLFDGRLVRGLIQEPLPDWILSEPASGMVEAPPLEFPAELAPFYETITIPVHANFRWCCVPEPDLYQYQTAPTRPYIIYKKVAEPSR